MSGTPSNFDRFSRLDNKQLRKTAGRFLNLGELFPRVKPHLNTRLNKYQAAKIRRSLRVVESIAEGAGIMDNDFVPVRYAKKYMTDNGLPPYLKGVFKSGGERDNKNLVYKAGQLSGERGGIKQIFVQLNNSSERALVEDLISAVERLPVDGHKFLAANGRLIRNSEGDESSLEANARMIYNKYVGMAARGEHRDDGRLAAHPKKWGIGLLWEERYKDERKNASQAWAELTDKQQAGWAEGAKYFKSTNFNAFKKVYNAQFKKQ